MGANARRRFGPIDTTPKEGTPIEERAIREVYDHKGGHLSNRQLKKRDRILELTNPTPTE